MKVSDKERDKDEKHDKGSGISMENGSEMDVKVLGEINGNVRDHPILINGESDIEKEKAAIKKEIDSKNNQERIKEDNNREMQVLIEKQTERERLTEKHTEWERLRAKERQNVMDLQDQSDLRAVQQRSSRLSLGSADGWVSGDNLVGEHRRVVGSVSGWVGGG